MNEIKRAIRSAKRYINSELKHGNIPIFHVFINTWDLDDRKNHRNINRKSNLRMNSTKMRFIYRIQTIS